jgi:hypothetical protein
MRQPEIHNYLEEPPNDLKLELAGPKPINVSKGFPVIVNYTPPVRDP